MESLEEAILKVILNFHQVHSDKINKEIFTFNEREIQLCVKTLGTLHTLASCVD